MAGNKNQVTLTFAGDSTQLEKTFDDIGSASKEMQTEVGKSSKELASKLEDGFDKGETRAMGFRDTLTGVQDTMGGLRDIAKGDLFNGFLTLGAGVGDLASGFSNLLIPALSQAVGWIGKTRVAQFLLNTVMAVNPIFLVIGAITALIAILVAIEAKTKFFSKLWDKVWGVIGDPVKRAWDFIKEKSGQVFDFITGLPRRIGRAFSGLFDILSGPFRTAFNFIARAWNNTVGQLRWTVPDWVPGIGGNSVGAPKLPTFHTGGIASGAFGQEMLAIVRAGERITPNGGSQPMTLRLESDGSRIGDLLVEILANAVRVRGGNVQFVLGAGNA